MKAFFTYTWPAMMFGFANAVVGMMFLEWGWALLGFLVAMPLIHVPLCRLCDRRNATP